MTGGKLCYQPCHPEFISGSYYQSNVQVVIGKIPNHLTATPTDTSSQGSLRIACSFCKVRNDMNLLVILNTTSIVGWGFYPNSNYEILGL